jgi:uncharacterized protein YjgD (DUF1641 family)
MSTKTQAELAGTELLQQRLQDPRVAEHLSRLLDHIETVSFAVDAVEGFVARSEVIIDSLTDGANELRQGDGQWAALLKQAPGMVETGARLADATKAIDVEELKRSKILERLSDPETLRQINSLLDRLPLLAFLAESTEGFIRRGETIADNVSGLVADLKLDESSLNADKLKNLLRQLQKMQEVTEKVLNSDLAGAELPKAIDAAQQVLNSGMLDKQVLETLGRIGRMSADAYQEVSSKPTQPLGGLWAMMRAAKDPEIQKTLGFAFAFAKAFAKHLPKI